MDNLRSGFLPELLAPAGDPEKLQTALIYGADAVYLGGRQHNLRAGARGFTWDEIDEALAAAGQWQARAYFCLNSLPRQDDLPALEAAFKRLGQTAFDGLILADPGTLRLARRHVPHLPVHLSTQANSGNSQAVEFWRDQGVSRINLARELSSREIKAIRRACPEVELEVFVHGAMCLAVSGQCHLSAYLSDRSANRGACTHPCRFGYRVRSVGLEEKQRPGRITWEVLDEEPFSALLASQDLCLIKHLAWFAANRIDALKIEGRTKSSSYLARVLDVYSTALADLGQGSFRPGTYLAELAETATRPLGSGFFLPGKTDREILPAQGACKPVVGRVESRLNRDCWLVAVKHRWPAGLPLEILVPGLRRPVIHPTGFALENETGSSMPVVHSGQWIRFRCDHPDLQPGYFLRLSAPESS